MAAQRTYLAIDLKSFYASVECVDRHLDPLTTNLVVADASRTEKTICLAVSPSLKAYKIPGRARLFEAVQRVREVNAQRLQTAIRQQKAVRGEDGKYHFASTSFDANALNADPALGLSYIVAPPRMQRYLDVSTQIYKTYLKYVSPADIYPYSIDEPSSDWKPTAFIRWGTWHGFPSTEKIVCMRFSAWTQKFSSTTHGAANPAAWSRSKATSPAPTASARDRC